MGLEEAVQAFVPSPGATWQSQKTPLELAREQLAPDREPGAVGLLRPEHLSQRRHRHPLVPQCTPASSSGRRSPSHAQPREGLQLRPPSAPGEQ